MAATEVYSRIQTAIMDRAKLRKPGPGTRRGKAVSALKAKSREVEAYIKSMQNLVGTSSEDGDRGPGDSTITNEAAQSIDDIFGRNGPIELTQLQKISDKVTVQ